MTHNKPLVLSVALPTPLRRLFDYLLPLQTTVHPCEGMRVAVPFGERKLVGVIESVKTESEVPADKLKFVDNLPDEQPLISAELMTLCRWAASYYHYSLGETLFHVLPPTLRQLGSSTAPDTVEKWQAVVPLDEETTAQLTRTPKQWAGLRLIANHVDGLSKAELLEKGFSAHILKKLQEKEMVTACQVVVERRPFTEYDEWLSERPLTLNSEQLTAFSKITSRQAFHPIVLDGVTGSGKTEVYLQAIGTALAAGRQAMVLVPEIGLTPQTVRRFQRRFSVPVVCLHSGVAGAERTERWHSAASATAGVLIATRSGVFTPMPRLGLIVVDEEHDDSYKQQETLRYNARDVAIYRARLADCPVVLGSATPSLETVANVLSGRFSHCVIKQRAGSARPPLIELVDLRGRSLSGGFSDELLEQIAATLSRQQQVVVFLNRRGYSPSLICSSCGAVMDCPWCDVHLTLHRMPPHMHCHHCDYQTGIPESCRHCGSYELKPTGQGTERCEQFLLEQFPAVPVIRVDRDSIRSKNALQDRLEQVNSGVPCILLGTQMLAKGHHFPKVTLVCVLNADSGLFSADFRGLEKSGQLILQVAGRAGRGERQGRVLIQTYNPFHPALQLLTSQPWITFAHGLLRERQQLMLPPAGHLALFRSECRNRKMAELLLGELKAFLLQQAADAHEMKVLGPIPATIERKQGRYRFQLYLSHRKRSVLHQFLSRAVGYLDERKQSKLLRWSLDVDPQQAD